MVRPSAALLNSWWALSFLAGVKTKTASRRYGNFLPDCAGLGPDFIQ
jgi:hypothetical protein